MKVDNLKELERIQALNAATGQVQPQMGVPTQMEEEPLPPMEEQVPAEAPVAPEAPSEDQSVSRSPDAFSNRTMVDMAVGATPTLLGLLGGASPKVMGMNFNQANKHAKAISDMDIPTKSNTTTLNVDGKPQLAMIQDSIGKEPYYSPKGVYGAGGSVGKLIPGKAWITNTDGSESLVDVMKNNVTGDTYDAYSKEPITRGRAYVPEKGYKTEDVRGNLNYTQIDPSLYGRENRAPIPLGVTPSVKPPSAIKKGQLEQGLGSYYKVGTKGQAGNVEKGMYEGQKEAQEISGSLVNVESALKQLKSSNDPRVFGGSMYTIAREVEPKGPFTAQDFNTITGTDYVSWLQNVKNTIETKGAGEIQTLRNSFIPLAEAIQKKMKARLGSVSSRYAPSSPEAQEGIKATIPSGSKSQKAEMLLFEQSASKMYGKGSDKYKRAVQFKKQQLGI